MLTALVPPLVAGAAALLSARRDRAVALREIELLAQLNPDSDEARHIRDLVGRRIRTWWHRETASTMLNATVALGCVAGLYILAVAALFIRHYIRAAGVDIDLARQRGDAAAVTTSEFAVSELGRVGDIVAIFLVVLALLGLLHSLIWLARFLVDRRRWLQHPYSIPAADLLRTDADVAVLAAAELGGPYAPSEHGADGVLPPSRSWLRRLRGDR